MGRLNPQQFPGEGPQVTNFDHCLHIVMVIGTCTHVFGGTFFIKGGQGEGVMWEDLSMEECIMREEIFDEGGAGFSSII